MILNIETATTNCSVSLAHEGLVVSFKEYANAQYSHAEQLHLFIKDVLKLADKSLSDLSAIAVSKGPGSYTGLRIGVSAAKGLCYALNIPLISVSTLRCLALPFKPLKGQLAVPMLDARRMEVYMCAFDHEMKQLLPTTATVIDANSLSDLTEAYEKVHLIGSGAEKVLELIEADNVLAHGNALPSAKDMAQLSFDQWKNKQFEDVAYFEPFYLKDFMAPLPKKNGV